jgi:hypothetical protein
MMEWRKTIQAVGKILQLLCIAQISIVGLSTNYPVVIIIGEVDSTNGYNSFILCLSAILIVWI